MIQYKQSSNIFYRTTTIVFQFFYLINFLGIHKYFDGTHKITKARCRCPFDYNNYNEYILQKQSSCYFIIILMISFTMNLMLDTYLNNQNQSKISASDLFQSKKKQYLRFYFIISLLKDQKMIPLIPSKPFQAQINTNVNIYLRNYKKQAILVPTTTPAKKSELLKFIADKFHLPPNKLAFFLNGKIIDSGEGEIQLKQKCIIHVVHRQRTKYESIKIILRTATSPPQRMLATVKSNAIIKSIFESHIQPFLGKSQREVFLAYLAKPLNIFKTFEEELVEHECQIVILQFKQSKIQELSIINSKYSKHPSVASTMMVGMPVKGGRSIHDPSKHKGSKSMNKNYHIGMEKVQEHSWGQNSPTHLKNQEQKSQQAAPNQEESMLQSAAPSQYCGFDPHQDKINFIKKEYIKKEETPQNISLQSSNPEKNQFSLTQKDSLYMAAPYMQQIENFSAGAISEFKQAFLKKKSMSGKDSKG